MPDNNSQNSSSDTQNQNNQDNQQQSNTGGGGQVVLGCDSNGVDDAGCMNTVKGILEGGGYQVEMLGIAPGPYAEYSYGDKAKGKKGVYLMAASLVSFLDAGDANFDFNVMGIRGDVTPWGTKEGFETKGVPKDHHGDCIHAQCDSMQGKTYPELNKEYKPDKVVATYGATPDELGKNILTALGGASPGGGSSAGGGAGAVLIPDKTFYGLIRQMMGAVDAMFIVANNMAYLLSFKDIYEYRDFYDEYIPKIETNQVIRDSVVKNYSTDSYYNAVEVAYADGIIKYQNDVLVKQYGENIWYYDFLEDDEETAKAKADALLSAHIRDYSTDIELSVFYNPRITEGSWVKVHKTLTQISGKTRKEIQQDAIKKEGKTISTKHMGVNITNLTEKTIIDEEGVSKFIQSITDEEGDTFDIELEKSDYELFFVQGYTIRWDKNNSLIMDLHLKYGPDTPEDPINATVGTMGGGGGTASAVGGQAADINAFVKQCLGGSAKQDRATAEKLYQCLQQLIVYSYYECSHYTTASECYQHAKELNCADTSRLVTACYKAAGFQCQVVWGPGHFWNELTIGSEVITVDLSSGSTGTPPSKPMGQKLSAGGSKQQDEGDNPHC